MPFSEFAEHHPPTSLLKGQTAPFVDMESLTPGRRYVRSSKQREFSGGGSRFRSGDILFARITPCLENGKIAQFIGGTSKIAGFGSTEFFVFRAKDNVSDPAFLFYLCLTDLLRKPAEKSMVGASGRQRADLKSVLSVEVPCPDMAVQRKVAGVLSAYDELIENNIRRIAILEEMAQALFREWFVHFRFPGHENVTFIESSLGKIPEGWNVVKVGEAVAISPKVSVPKDGEKPFVSMGAVPENTLLIDIEAVEMRTGNSGSKFQNGDTLFARITPCLENGKTAFVQFLERDTEVAFGSTEFIVLRSKSVCPEFVYLLARSDPFRDNAIKSMSGATGRQRVQEKCFDSFLIAHPDQDTLEAFSELIQPVFRQAFTLDRTNRNLRKTRDLLLPKLIDGQLAVEDLEIEIGEPLVEAVA
jgi:type I restriction enzyme S subunit